MISAKIKDYFASCKPDNYYSFSKYKRVVWNILFVSLLLSVFLTILFQMPTLAAKGINHVADVIWVLDLVLLLLFDYKNFLDRVIKVGLVTIPFSVYLLVATIFKQPAFTGSSLTKAIYLSVFIMIVWLSYSPMFKYSNVKLFMAVYIVAALLLAFIVYVGTLRGSDISSSYYVYSSKNSTGPILFVAIIFSYFLLNEKRVGTTIIRFLLYIFFVVIIALMKCRTVLVFLPIAFIYIFRLQYQNNLAFIILIFSILLGIVLLLFVPYFRDVILFKILLNGKQNSSIDDIFSGRLSIIYHKLTTNTNYVFGNFSTYFDCMPLLLVVNYGFVGFLLLLPIVIMPFFLVAKNFRIFGKNNWIVKLQVLFLFSFFFFSILEGLVPFGPGAETFVFWMVVCCTYRDDLKIYTKVELFFSSISSKVSLVLNKRVLVTCISSILYGGLLFFILSPSFFYSVSSSCFDILPVGKATMSYVKPESISIKGPSELCVGQMANYESIFYPSKTTDKGTRWDALASNNEISIDEFNGTVIANRVGKNITIIGKSSKSYSTYGRKTISIVEPSNYNFNLFEIYNEENRFSYKKGETAKILYDVNYIPRIDLLTFTSSDESIATVNNEGVVNFVGNGTVEIHSTIKNNYHNKSNVLVFNVSSSDFVPTTSLSVNIPNSHHQFEPLEVIPSFNNDATDKHYDIDIIGGPYDCNSNSKVVFLSQGVYRINICSRNNPALKITQDINILANSPKSIEYCGDVWWKVGKMDKLDLRLKYFNGFEKELLPSEIVTTNNDYSKRAWISKNGICGDELSAIAITSGNMAINFSLKQDPDINITILIKCNRFDYLEYRHYVYLLGAIISLFFSLLFLFTFFLNELQINEFILLVIYLVLFSPIAFILVSKYSLSSFLLIPFFVMLFAYLAFVFFLLIKKRSVYIEVFCESIKPNNYPIFTNRITNYYKLDI